MALNKEHPLYDAYQSEWDAMVEWYKAECDKIPNEWGHETESGLLAKEMHKKVREIQTKYADVFIDDDEVEHES